MGYDKYALVVRGPVPDVLKFRMMYRACGYSSPCNAWESARTNTLLDTVLAYITRNVMNFSAVALAALPDELLLRIFRQLPSEDIDALLLTDPFRTHPIRGALASVSDEQPIARLRYCGSSYKAHIFYCGDLSQFAALFPRLCITLKCEADVAMGGFECSIVVLNSPCPDATDALEELDFDQFCGFSTRDPDFGEHACTAAQCDCKYWEQMATVPYPAEV